MSGRARLSFDLWPLPCERLLRNTGDPARLEYAAAVMERLAHTNSEETNEERKAAARALRQAASAARVCLDELKALGLDFDFERGCAVLRHPGRGAPRKLLSIIIGHIFEDLADDEWYTPATYARIRDALAHFVPPEELPDSLIRRAIERHVNKRI